MQKRKFLACCSKLWNPSIAESLSRSTEAEFHLITQKEDLNLPFLSQYKPELIFFPHWSYIIPPEIFNFYKCIIFHMTDLPYGRGGSPLQNLIIRGHSLTKVSALICTEDLDAGDILLKKDLPLEGSAEKIFKSATTLIESMIQEIIEHFPTPQPQVGEVTLFSRRTPEQSNLNACKALLETYNQIRMVDSDLYPRAFLKTPNDIKYEFYDAEFDGTEIVAKVRIKK